MNPEIIRDMNQVINPEVVTKTLFFIKEYARAINDLGKVLMERVDVGSAPGVVVTVHMDKIYRCSDVLRQIVDLSGHYTKLKELCKYPTLVLKEIEYKNGILFLVFRHGVTTDIFQIDSMHPRLLDFLFLDDLELQAQAITEFIHELIRQANMASDYKKLMEQLLADIKEKIEKANTVN